ncbi:MAG: histidinol-phosphate transaminase [Deltaproteobacteria bacterium]|nr:histidinol-phosphate transaminase [Deltaproteobacteria bacterium]
MPGEIQGFIDGLRPEIRTLPLYNAGLSTEYVKATYNVEHVAKLGSNENSFPPSPKVLTAIESALSAVGLYPDPSCRELRTALAQRLDVSPERLMFGNGSDDVIAVAVQTFLSPGDEVVTISPSYGLHVIFPLSFGATVRAVPIGPDNTADVEALTAAIGPRTRMVMFSNPSNPVGTSIGEEDLQRLLAAIPENALLIFDEAYFEYAAADNAYPSFLGMLERWRRPWLVLRTFSKAYGIAGLRVGYAIASDAALVDLMDRVRGPFNVNRLAQAAALAALQDAEYARDCVVRTTRERERVRRALGELGYRPVPSLTNFLFFDVHTDSAELAKSLLPHGVIVKAWRDPGFSNHIRVSIGSREANDQFLAAMQESAMLRAAMPGTEARSK